MNGKLGLSAAAALLDRPQKMVAHQTNQPVNPCSARRGPVSHPILAPVYSGLSPPYLRGGLKVEKCHFGGGNPSESS